ncbi:MAG: hypothetical protein JNL57_00905 [Bacteroidetes bacterium]|nr:hypothetical protein [Bacteroidota bacterium]
MEELIKERNRIIWETDNTPGILDYCFPDGTSFWLAIRLELKFTMINSRANKEVNWDSRIHFSRWKFYRYLLFSFWKSPFLFAGKTDVLRIANWEKNPECPNRMTQFLTEYPQLSQVQLLYSQSMDRFGHLPGHRSFDYFYYASLFWARIFRRRPNAAAENEVAAFIGLLKQKMGDWLTPEIADTLRRKLLQIHQLVPGYTKRIQKYLNRVKPKLVVVSEGNNGDWQKGSLFKICRESGIPTVEVQHGTVGIGMKYGEELVKDSKFKQHKTNYFFTFGMYHSQIVNAVDECVEFGHYFLEKSLENITRIGPDPEGRVRILFIGEGIPYTAKDNGLVLAVSAALEQLHFPFQVTVRLHPTEEPNARYAELMKFEGARYSQVEDDNIYQLISDHEIIIGHISTVLFEALYFNKEPYVFEDDYTYFALPEGLGLWFKNGTELRGLMELNFPPKPVHDEVKRLFWAKGTTRENFTKFWNEKVGKPILN